MSRLYGRSYDVYRMSRYINELNIPKYKEDNKKVSMDELIDSTAILDLYLPKSAIEYIENCPIEIVKSPLIPRNASKIPTKEDNTAIIYFKGLNFKEENKRELCFFLGTVLSLINPDKLPKDDDLPCEYGDLFSLLLEYIYLKSVNKEDTFLLKHLNALDWNGKKYVESYENFQKYLVNDKVNDFLELSEVQLNKIEEEKNQIEKQFLSATLNTLVPLSSVDGILQLKDILDDEESTRKLINKLFENKDNDRQKILKDYGVESYGYKTLTKVLGGK